jgi:hypothetical protein
MSAILLAASAMVVAGGIACVAGRRPAVIALGAGLMLTAIALATDPPPPTLTLAARAVAAALTAELLWIGLRSRPQVGGASALAWPAIGFLGAAAFAVGYGAGEGSSAGGPPVALGAALALLTLTVVALVGRFDGVQRSLVALPLVAAAELIRVAFVGPPSSLEGLLVAGLGMLLAGVVLSLSAGPATQGSPALPARDTGPVLDEPDVVKARDPRARRRAPETRGGTDTQ